MLNRYLGREADHAAIEDGEAIRFFPDVRAGSWYYEEVMEAVVSHTACYETEEAAEAWQDASVPSPGLQNGFYLIGGKLYAAMGGELLHAERSSVLNGVSFRCGGADGVCSAETEVLALADGELIFLSGGSPAGNSACRSAGCFIHNS